MLYHIRLILLTPWQHFNIKPDVVTGLGRFIQTKRQKSKLLYFSLAFFTYSSKYLQVSYATFPEWIMVIDTPDETGEAKCAHCKDEADDQAYAESIQQVAHLFTNVLLLHHKPQRRLVTMTMQLTGTSWGWTSCCLIKRRCRRESWSSTAGTCKSWCPTVLPDDVALVWFCRPVSIKAELAVWQAASSWLGMSVQLQIAKCNTKNSK